MNVKIKKIGKKYEGRSEYTLENINLDIHSKEFVVILGPSGSGKTTLLRMISGLISITKGDLLFNNRRVNELSPSERGIAMVFQSYALYPQMTVYKNIAYGLKIRKIRKDLIDSRVRDVAKILDIEEYLYNKPADLSGGQRQRVAIGRAIARKPSIFLMDEPLSNLDAKLREKMRKELVQIHKLVGSTTIYVTHDQLEAMTMSDRIILINDSEIQQVGKPISLYQEPNNLFVAGFIGSPTMNFIEGYVKNGQFISESKDFKLNIEHKNIKNGRKVVLGYRPENAKIIIKKPKDPNNYLKAKTFISELLGKDRIIYLNDYEGASITITTTTENSIEDNKNCFVSIDNKKIHLFDKESTYRILKNGEEVIPESQKHE